MMIIVFTVMLIAVIGIVIYYVYKGSHFISTDNASVQGDTVNAVTLISAKMTELDVSESQSVEKDAVIARQDMKGQDVTKVESSVVRAPISGIILKTSGVVGAIIPAGSTVAVMVDPSALYITANIDETDLSKLKLGQKTDVTIDQFKGVKFSGEVSSIGKATSSTFSLLPTSASGTFTKVVQTIPVKIKLDKNDYELSPGTSAEVKIHIK